ncbi:MAG: PAS domain S-box protein [Candidatus Woesearchaeota archaeon]
MENIFYLLDNLPSMIFIADETGKCTYFNNAWRQYTGKDLDKEIGMGFTEEVHPEDLNNCMKYFSEQSTKKISFEMNFRLKNKENQYHLIKSVCTPLFYDNKYIGYIGSCIDVQNIIDTEIKNKQFFEAIEQNPSSIVITDINGNIEYVNPKFTEVTGYSREEVLGKNPRILKSGVHDTTFYKNLWDTITSGKTWRGNFYNKKKNGEIYIEDASISPIFLDEKIKYFVAVKLDITESVKNEELLKQRNEELEKINKLAVDRELKMIELKKEIKELKEKLEKIKKNE